jgi:hypothetical protein
MKILRPGKPVFASFKRVSGIVALMLISQQAIALAILLGEPANGGKILEARCTACHVSMFGDDGSKIYTRDDHQIKTVEGLMNQVSMCNERTQNGELNADQLDDITAHLNETFYKYDD